MFIDSKGKLFGKISIIDVLIVVIVLVGVAGLAYKLNVSKSLTPFKASDSIQTSFFVEELPDYVANSIKEGSNVVDPVKNSVFGTVKEVKVGDSVSFASNSEGKIVLSPRPGYKSVLIVVEGKGAFSNDGVTFGSNTYFIGKSMEVRAGNTAVWARIYDIKKIGA